MIGLNWFKPDHTRLLLMILHNFYANKKYQKWAVRKVEIGRSLWATVCFLLDVLYMVNNLWIISNESQVTNHDRPLLLDVSVCLLFMTVHFRPFGLCCWTLKFTDNLLIKVASQLEFVNTAVFVKYHVLQILLSRTYNVKI